MLQHRVFFALASRSGFGAAISDAVARSIIAFCNSVSADRIIMAALRLLRAAAACVILLSFAAGSIVIFLLKILLKCASKSCFFRFGVEIYPVLELQIRTPLRVVLAFCNSVCAHRIVVAALRLLPAAAACVILLSFAA